MPLLLFAGALWIRLYRLDVQPLWLDEGQTWAIVTGQRLGALVLDLFRPTQAYPLFHLLLKVDTRLLGDSEWSLRLPSAVAGALAVPAMFLLGRELRDWLLGLGAALLLLVSPFAIWQSQDAKAYSMTLLATILLALTLARALRLNTRRSWLLFAAVALIAPFTHRLLVFTLLGCAIAWGLRGIEDRGSRIGDRRTRTWRSYLALGGALAAGIALAAALVFAQDAQGAGGQFAAVGPLRAAWLTLGQFAIGQWPGTVRRLWLLPSVLLLLVGGVRLLRDLRGRRHLRGALIVLALGGAPTLLFAVVLAQRPFYEPRYLTIVYPFWLLALAWTLPTPIGGRGAGIGDQPRSRSFVPTFFRSRFSVLSSWLLVLGACLVAFWALYLPNVGLFSGAIVKENYRDMIRVLAEHVHPDDMVIVHPDSVVALYGYYGPRVSDHPLPAPVTYYWLGRSDQFKVRELESKLLPELQQRRRAWLLIAPAHAAVVDRPKQGDELGLIGLAFQYGDLNKRFLCGTPNADKSYAASVGVKLYCNAMPDYGQIQPPAVAQPILFGDRIRFLGYTLRPFTSGVHPGGTLPLTLYWSPTQALAGSDYRMFVHLTTPDNPKPLAQIDGQPLEGGLPTALWTKPNDTIHDERTIKLINIETGEPIPPGRYLLRIGVWDANAGGQRLAASGTQQPMIDDAVVIGEVEVLPR